MVLVVILHFAGGGPLGIAMRARGFESPLVQLLILLTALHSRGHGLEQLGTAEKPTQANEQLCLAWFWSAWRKGCDAAFRRKPSCHVMSCHVRSRHVMLRHSLSCHVM